MSERITFAALVVLEVSVWLILLGIAWGANPILAIPWFAFGVFLGGMTYDLWRHR